MIDGVQVTDLVCPKCIEGRYWLDGDKSGSCTSCSSAISNCNSCSLRDNDEVFCDICSSNRVTDPDGHTCIKFSNCAVSSDKYEVVDDKVTCPQCSNYHIFNYTSRACENTCDDFVEGCKVCRNDGTCSECDSASAVLTPDHLMCKEGITVKSDDTLSLPRCIKPLTASLDGTHWECPECEQGYYWNRTQEACVTCLIPDCDKCDYDECFECKGDMFP